ncbi:MAG: type II toxin-antitoxin system PemK/MazF family toxin [Candidatus Taylorbacteria bacterium]|nr:type II toxin-antitoxin system PemK/MazF family toxin [Candidatus Taylorbacteria bacterium]
MKIDSEIIYRHIDWMKLKSKIDLFEAIHFPRKKEIWWISFGQNVGVEINGKNNRFERPALVLKVFNADSFLVAPITSKIKSGQYLFGFMSPSGEKQTVNLSQFRTVSVKRFIRKIGVITDSDFNQIADIIINFIEKTETPFGVSSESSNGR